MGYVQILIVAQYTKEDRWFSPTDLEVCLFHPGVAPGEIVPMKVNCLMSSSSARRKMSYKRVLCSNSNNM